MTAPGQDRLVAVTGASRGIGAAIALELARRGFRVACLTRKGAGPQVAGASALAASFVNHACDVNDEASVRAALEAVTAGGVLHGLVNNAGIHLDAPSHEMDTALYERVMQTNATAVFTACREAYPYLARAGGATVVNIGSFFDKVGVKRNLAYCASKAAVGAITRCLAVEWASKGIRVIDIAPGYVVTDLNRESLERGPVREYIDKRIPGRRPGTAEEIAKLVAAMYSEDIPFLTGETIYIDGGQGMAH
ncbi:MAG: short-chain dehydrogenase [Betaproteobacteria bacterium]|nr:short-chain dehydrogenase [Betaproteobacteria bacterium]